MRSNDAYGGRRTPTNGKALLISAGFVSVLFAAANTIASQNTPIPSPDQAAVTNAGVLAGAVLESSPESAGRIVSAKELVETKHIQSFAVSPDGRKLVYQLLEPDADSNNLVLNWYLVALGDSTSTPMLIASGGMHDFYVQPDNGLLNGEIAPPSLGWASDSASVFFTKKDASGTQIWRTFTDGGPTKQVTHNDADVADFEVSSDNAKILFEVGRARSAGERADAEELHRGFLVGDETLFVAHGPPGSKVAGQLSRPPCGEATHGFEPIEPPPCSLSLWTVDLNTKAERSATQQEMSEWSSIRKIASNMRFGILENPPNGARLSSVGTVTRLKEAADDSGQGWLPVRVLSATLTHGGPEVSCNDVRCSGQFLNVYGWTAAGDRVIFSRIEGRGLDGNSAGSSRAIYSWNPQNGRVTAVARDAGLMFDFPVPSAQSGRSCQLLSNSIICLRQSNTYPDTLVQLNLGPAHKETTLVDPNSWFSTVWHPRIDTIVWTDDFGDEVVGRLIFPKGYQPGRAYPLVVCGYNSDGFAWTSNSDEFPSGLFAQSGMMVLRYDQPENFRSMAKKLSRATATVDFWKRDLLRDRPLNSVRKAINLLASRHLIDPERVGITGLSSGAALVDHAMIFTHEFVAASAAYSTAHPMTYYLGTKAGRQVWNKLYEGRPSDSGSLWNKESVGPNASSITTALLLDVADNEYYEAYPNFADLSDAGRAVEMYVFPDEYHVKWQPAHHLYIYRRNVQWFQFWLLDHETDDPLDPGQYSRWHSLRQKRAQAVIALKGSALP